MDIFQLITNTSTENNIKYDNLEKYNGGFMKLNIYNPDICIPMHKFWFFIENVKIIKISNNTLDIALSTTHNNIIYYIDKMEINIENYIKTNISKKNTLKKIIEQHNSFFPIMKIKLTESSIIYDENDEIVDKNIIQQNNIVSLCIELNNIIINKTNHSSWLSFDVVQIKQHKLFDMKKSLFVKKQVTNIPPPPPPLPSHLQIPGNIQLPSHMQLSNNLSDQLPNYSYLPQKSETGIHTIKNKPIEKPLLNRLSISTNDIVSQLSKLKKINNPIIKSPFVTINSNSNLNSNLNSNNDTTLNKQNIELINNNDLLIQSNDDLKNESMTDLKNESMTDLKSESMTDLKSESGYDLKSESNHDLKSESVTEMICDINSASLDDSNSENNLKNKKSKPIKIIYDNETKEKHENFLNVMDEMINKIKKKNKKVNKQILMVDNMMSNI